MTFVTINSPLGRIKIARLEGSTCGGAAALEATLGRLLVRRIARVDALILERVSRARFVFPVARSGRARVACAAFLVCNITANIATQCSGNPRP